MLVAALHAVYVNFSQAGLRMGQDWDILVALKDGEKDPLIVYQRESHAKDPGFFLLPRTESKKNIQVKP